MEQLNGTAEYYYRTMDHFDRTLGHCLEQWTVGILMEGDSCDKIEEHVFQRMKNNNATVCLHDRTLWHCNVIRDIVLGYSDMVMGQSGIVLRWWVS